MLVGGQDPKGAEVVVLLVGLFGRKFVSLVGLSVEFGRLLAVTRRDRERGG